MGILQPAEDLLRRLVATLPPGFMVLEFGDQMVTHSDPHELAAKLYKRLGAKRYLSVDGNARGNITFDLNRPARELEKLMPKWGRPGGGRGFHLVTDFGTGEHIFDQAQFFRTVHHFTRPGGLMVFDRPSQGYDAHCFWRTDLSTYRDIAAANRYEILDLAPHAGRLGRDGARGELVMGVMRKEFDAPFKLPQQGRYKKLLRPLGEAAT